MARGRVAKIVLSDEEAHELRLWAGGRKIERRLAQRAEVILGAAAGQGVAQASAASGLSPQACSKWRGRFVAQRLEGLRDRPRAGRPRTIAPATRLAVISRATETPPGGRTRWTQRQLAAVVGISPASVNRVLKGGDLKPHKTDYWCGRSPDPEFAAKQAAILGLYLEPPSGALVLSVDEKSQIQALDRTQPELPLRPGKPRRLTATYKRHGTTCLLAALSIATGTVEARCLDRTTHKEFLAFLKHLYRKHPRRELHIILDNLSVHKHHSVLDWAARRRRLHLHFTPTYASWLNQIEIWFRILTKAVLEDGVWRAKAHLVAQIMAYIADYNATQAHPFKWTYTGQPLAA
jgi:transcriptional regulator with XRE-family HTH domain